WSANPVRRDATATIASVRTERNCLGLSGPIVASSLKLRRPTPKPGESPLTRSPHIGGSDHGPAGLSRNRKKQVIVAEIWVVGTALPSARRPGRDLVDRARQGALRGGRNCGFEGLGFPKSPAARPVETPSADDAPGRAPSPSPCGGTARRMDGLIDGATTTMLVLKRLTAAAVTIGALITGVLAGLFTGLGAAWAGDGQPSPWQFGFQSSATPVMDKIVEFHTF